MIISVRFIAAGLLATRMAVVAFSPAATTTAIQQYRRPIGGSTPRTWTKLNSVFDITEGMDLHDKMEAGRGAFYFWFLGASGAAGIGRKAFPLQYDRYKEKQTLKDMGPTSGGAGGDMMNLSPLCGYPKDLAVADVEKVLGNPLPVEKMVEKYPVEGNFLSKKGYLTYDAFQRANEGCNPLSVRAVFDTLNRQSDVVEPQVAQEKLDLYSNKSAGGLGKLKSELLLASATSFLAFFGLCFLLFFADYEAFIVHGLAGWFPNWPGLEDFPNRLLDPDVGITKILDYYIWELPERGAATVEADGVRLGA